MAEIDYAQEGVNLKINSAYKSIMKESKQNFIDGMNAYQAKDYPKAKALITKAKNSFEKGYWSIYDADKPAEGKTTPMAAGMFTGNIASGTLGVYRTLKENKIFKKYFPNVKFDINDAAERKIVQAATLGLQQDNSKAPYATLNDFKRDMSLIVNAYKHACEYVLNDIDKKMGRQKPTNESFYMEDDEMNDNLSMYDLIKLESTLAYYEKQEEAMEGTNTKLTFGYAKMMKDGRKFLQEAKNLLSTKNYKDARDNVFKARKCFVAAYNEINNLPESKISSATGMIMSAIVGTARIINASNELNDFKGYKWAAKLHDVAAVRQLLRQVNVIVGNSSVTNASIYERKRSVAPTNAKFTSNVYKKDILMIIKAYIEVCEVMMRDIGSMHSTAKESTAAIEEYYTDMLHMGAVMEGKNLDVNRRFSDSITAGSKEIEKALMYMRNDRYTEAVEHLDTASDKFETAIQQIHNVDGGILADTIIGGIMRDFVGTYRMFVAASNLKAYGTVGKDWGTKLRIRSVIRILAIGGLPGAGAVDMGLNIGRRVTNTKLEAERGKHKKFTFNGFKEDCINVLNAYMETIEDLKDKVKEAQNNNLSYHQSNILESAIEDEVATEGANLNLNKKFSEIVDKAYKEMKDGAYFLKAGKYEKANAKFKTAKATLENGMDEIDAIDGGILSETILGMLFSGIVGMYRIFDEADNMALLDGVAGFGDGRKTANKLINASIVRYLNALFNVFAGTYLVMLGGMGAAVGWKIVGQMAAELGTVFAVPAAISNIASGASKLIRRDANVKASEKRGKYQKFSLNAFKEDLRYILNGYIEITDNLIERTNTLLEKE